MITNMKVEDLCILFHKQKYLMIYVKYVLTKENKNLLYLNAITKFVYNAFLNSKEHLIINLVQFADNIIGLNKIKMNICLFNDKQ